MCKAHRVNYVCGITNNEIVSVCVQVCTQCVATTAEKKIVCTKEKYKNEN